MELGGTVGDIEQGPFIEALRQFEYRVGTENFCNIHVSLVPIVGSVGEQKTKPTQASVRELRALGLSPDLIVCRSAKEVQEDVRRKVALFCSVQPQQVISVHDVSNLYRVPLLLQSQGVPSLILKRLNISVSLDEGKLQSWKGLADLADELAKDSVPKVRIAMVGKYTDLSDAYLSVSRALQHASFVVQRKLVIEWIESAFLEPEYQEKEKEKYEEAWAALKGADGILVPGGFGDRGTEGKILAANYARTQKKPYLGICLGLQIAVIEFARNVLGLAEANSTEFNKDTPHNVVIFMPEGSKEIMGATMRLGKRRTDFVETDSLARALYHGVDHVDERHRHRYEVNPDYIPQLEKAGLRFVGFGDNRLRAEVIELPDHPFFLATQYHPEFLSRPGNASPPFVGLMLAASGQLQSWLEKEKENKNQN